MAKQLKCPECGTLNDKENTIFYNKRYYCKDTDCLEKKKAKVAQNSDGWDSLYEYMGDLFGEVDGGMISLIAKYRKEPYNYKNSGMELTLRYFYDTLGNLIQRDSSGVGIIPYYYRRARDEYIENIGICEYNSSIEFSPIVKKIKIKPMKTSAKERYKNKLIDMSRLGEHIKNE